MTRRLADMTDDYDELVKDYQVTSTAAAILILADAITSLGNCPFQPAMHEFGHELALSLKNVLKESVIQTETEINGNLALTVEKL
jgi:hypothetical protein